MIDYFNQGWYRMYPTGGMGLDYRWIYLDFLPRDLNFLSLHIFYRIWNNIYVYIRIYIGVLIKMADS